MTSAPVSAAILAGGLATRLRPLTETIPKSLIDVNGEPFIAHQLRLLRENQIERVVLCVGYLGEEIQEIIGDGARFDLMLDTVGNRSVSECRSVLVPRGSFVSCSGGTSATRWLFRLAWMRLASLFTNQRLKTLLSAPNREDLLFLKELVEAGKAKPVIQRRYALRQTSEALRRVGEGHSQGQTVIQIAG